MIIDALAHITRDGGWFGTGLDASLPTLLLDMDRNRVNRAVLVGIPGLDDDALILDAAQGNPGRFLPVAGLDYALEGNLEARLERIREMGFAGVKLHPRLSGAPLTDPRLHEATRLAGKLDLTAMICTIHRPPLPPLGRPIADALYELCRNCDETRIVLVHGGYTDLLATSELIRPMEHVLLDLTLTLTRFARTSVGLDCAWLLETFDRRVCVGSDFPEGGMDRVGDALDAIGTGRDALVCMAENTLRFFPQPGGDV